MILDTNGLSAMADGNKDLEPLLRQAEDVAIPVIVLGEYRYGIGQSRARYERWLANLIAACRVLSADETTANEYAGIQAELKRDGRPIPGNDLWIAALARQHRLLSRDAHFDNVPGLIPVRW